jgi:hypothetical protein
MWQRKNGKQKKGQKRGKTKKKKTFFTLCTICLGPQGLIIDREKEFYRLFEPESKGSEQNRVVFF